MTKSCCSPGVDPRDPSAPDSAPGSHASARAAPHEVARIWCAIPAGTFTMGNDGADANPGDDEGPARPVTLGAFRIGASTVTNAEFGAFVRATHHVTDAERLGSSFVFYLQAPARERAQARRAVAGLPWWLPVAHASWQRPEGPGSHLHQRMGHPVVHVSWHDAQAYCACAGARLPT